MSDLYEYGRHIADVYLIPIGLKIGLALVVFVLGRMIARGLVKAFDRMLERSRLEVSLRKFLGDIAYAVLLVAVVIAALDVVGVQTTAVVAVLGAAGLAVGLALQGSLGNFAAGVMLIILRPYKVTDLVVLGKYVGRVDAIKVFNTVLVTGDNREIIIPNGQIISAPIENLTALGRRRIDFVVTITDAHDLAQLKQLLAAAAADDARIQAAPPPAVEVSEVTEAGVKLNVQPWTTVDAYDAVATEALERIQARLIGAGLKFKVAIAAPA